MIRIRESKETELETVLSVELDAFHNDPEIRTLVQDLFMDESAKPIISLLAFDGDEAVGHVYFSAATIDDCGADVMTMLLAPLAVRPSHQKKGIGQQLIYAAFEKAAQIGVKVIFVLGHPTYYPHCGFVPAGVKGFLAPYPIPEENANAWMMHELQAGVLAGLNGGTVRCASSLMKPQYWRE